MIKLSEKSLIFIKTLQFYFMLGNTCVLIYGALSFIEDSLNLEYAEGLVAAILSFVLIYFDYMKSGEAPDIHGKITQWYMYTSIALLFLVGWKSFYYIQIDIATIMMLSAFLNVGYQVYRHNRLKKYYVINNETESTLTQIDDKEHPSKSGIIVERVNFSIKKIFTGLIYVVGATSLWFTFFHPEVFGPLATSKTIGMISIAVVGTIIRLIILFIEKMRHED